MELVQELLLTAFVAVVFSFVVAKLVSIAMAGGDAASASVTLRDVDESVLMEELQFGEKLNVGILESEGRVEFVEESVEKVDELREELIQVDEIASPNEEIEIDSCKSPEKLTVILESEERVEFVEESVEKVDELGEELIQVDEIAPRNEEIEMDSCQLPEKLTAILESEDKVEFVEESVEKVDDLGEELIQFQVDEIASRKEEIEMDSYRKSEEVVELLQKDSSEEKEANADVIEECEDRESKDGIGLVIDDDDDEEWEGIERSEVEKIFDAAAKSAGSGDKDDLLSDVQMELYGLHKVATEGPCREPQPMTLMLSARAKWNAWKKLGNMSPEEAMEQYVTLLSDKVPGWREEKYSRDGKLESQEAGTPDPVAPDLSSISGHQTNYTHERTSESKSGNEGGDMTGGLSSETKVNE